ncbi:MAG: ATP-binding protein [Myxococcota bacterium]|nr:ATP-binding protein [Myxococcota bacterium]
MWQLLRRVLELGIDASVSEFDAQRIRTLNVGVSMAIAVAVLSLPVTAATSGAQTIPGTLLFLAVTSLVVWLQARGRAYQAALSITALGISLVSLQAYYLGPDFGVHFWLLALIPFPFLFFPRNSTHTPTLLGALIVGLFFAFALRDQAAQGYSNESLATQALTATLILGISFTMRRLLIRAERTREDHRLRVEHQAEQLRERQHQLEIALEDAGGARRALDRRVAERTAELQRAHDRLSRELEERTRMEQERRMLEAELQHAQRLESIGQLAGRVAHDFNNLLTVIGGNLDLVLEGHGSMTETQRTWLREAQAATDRGVSVTGQLLAYSRKQAVVLQSLEPRAAIEGVRQMIERAAGEKIRLEIEVADPVGKVRAGRGQLEQVLMNLVLNACDAMPGGGTLRIEVEEVASAPRSGSSQQVAERPHVVWRVSDTGRGMDEETRSRVFEPFFTTKSWGKGTGLGLSVVHGIVTQHQGRLEVESRPGKGACFSIYLPVAQAEPAGASHATAPGAPKSSQGETILVVEDERAVRRFTSSLLERLGYHVLAAESGEQALVVADKHPGPIDLLLTDVVMSGLQGPELATQLLELYPKTRVLFVSGYTDPERFVDLGLNEQRSFLQKPFSIHVLERRIRDLLDGTNPAPGEGAD